MKAEKQTSRQADKRADSISLSPAIARYCPLSPARSSAPQHGVIALMTVIIIGAMILGVGISAAMIGQTEIVLSGQSDRAYAARSLASACVEEGLHRLKLNSAYVGGTVSIGLADTCTVTVSGAGGSRTVTATAASGEFTKSIIVTATLRQNAALNSRAWHIDSWTEGDPP